MNQKELEAWPLGASRVAHFSSTISLKTYQNLAVQQQPNPSSAILPKNFVKIFVKIYKLKSTRRFLISRKTAIFNRNYRKAGCLHFWWICAIIWDLNHFDTKNSELFFIKIHPPEFPIILYNIFTVFFLSEGATNNQDSRVGNEMRKKFESSLTCSHSNHIQTTDSYFIMSIWT